jgi:hypothetical protein
VLCYGVQGRCRILESRERLLPLGDRLLVPELDGVSIPVESESVELDAEDPLISSMCCLRVRVAKRWICGALVGERCGKGCGFGTDIFCHFLAAAFGVCPEL